MFVNKTEPGQGIRIDLADGSHIWICDLGRRGRFNKIGVEVPANLNIKRVTASELQQGLDDAELDQRN